MATRISIPGLLNLVLVKTPIEAAAADDAAGIDRPLSGRGRLVNRLIASKLVPFKMPDGQPWPAFSARLDPLRAKHQRELEEVLSRTDNLLQRISAEISELARFVCDRPTARPVGVTAQQAVGRLFYSDYCATEDSYEAAVTLSTWLSAGPLKSLRMKLTGRFQKALDLVIREAHDDSSCAHATGLALHNIVESVTLMRQLARSADGLQHLSPADAAARTLRAPPRVIREARDSVCVPNLRVKARSLILIGVESVRKYSGDAGTAFFASQWNRCPAHSFVPALLAEVWRVASESR